MNLVVFDIDGTLVKYHKKRNDQAFVRAVKEVWVFHKYADKS
jgi:hydroxymethylpyrimidine pyrophosphatase-like HAD family hydrolase